MFILLTQCIGQVKKNRKSKERKRRHNSKRDEGTQKICDFNAFSICLPLETKTEASLVQAFSRLYVKIFLPYAFILQKGLRANL